MHLLLRWQWCERRRRGPARRAAAMLQVQLHPLLLRFPCRPPRGHHAAHQQRKGLLNIDTVSRAGLHEAAAVRACPLKPCLRGHLPLRLQVALIARDDLDGADVRHLQRLAIIPARVVGGALKARLRLHVN